MKKLNSNKLSKSDKQIIATIYSIALFVVLLALLMR